MTPTERTTYYLEKLFWPFLGALAIAIITPFTNIQWMIVAWGEGLFALSAALFTMRAGLHWKEAAIMSGLAGSTCALGFSVVTLILHFSVPDIFAIIPRMVISGAACGLLAGFTTELLYLSKRAQKRARTQRSNQNLSQSDVTMESIEENKTAE